MHGIAQKEKQSRQFFTVTELPKLSKNAIVNKNLNKM
jgi:hypothetical protein